MLTAPARRLAARCLGGLAGGLARLGVDPNGLTLLGVVLHLPVVALLAAPVPLWPAGLALAAAGLFDALDGMVARAGGAESRFGAFLDSVTDRTSESLLCFGLLLRAELTADWALARWSIVLVTGSLLVSYTRARAAGIGLDTQAGWFGRLERMVVLVAGLLSGWIVPAAAFTALGAWATAWARLVDVRRQTRAAATSAEERRPAGVEA